MTFCFVVIVFIKLEIIGAIKWKSTAIAAILITCLIDSSCTFDSKIDDTNTPPDKTTITNEALNASFGVIPIFATFSNAAATKTIAIPSPTTDRKFISPTNLNAIPIANTATAIRSIEATPFFIELSFFGSASKSPVFLSDSFFLDISKIVFCCFRISSVSFLIDWTPILISFICSIKLPLCRADVVSDLDPPLSLSDSAIISRAFDRLSSAFSNCLSIKNFYLQSIYKIQIFFFNI